MGNTTNSGLIYKRQNEGLLYSKKEAVIKTEFNYYGESPRSKARPIKKISKKCPSINFMQHAIHFRSSGVGSEDYLDRPSETSVHVSGPLSYGEPLRRLAKEASLDSGNGAI